jgi:hypothetical protein
MTQSQLQLDVRPVPVLREGVQEQGVVGRAHEAEGLPQEHGVPASDDIESDKPDSDKPDSNKPDSDEPDSDGPDSDRSDSGNLQFIFFRHYCY